MDYTQKIIESMKTIGKLLYEMFSYNDEEEEDE